MEHHIGIGRYYDDKIEWDNSSTNEIRGIELDKDTPCATQFKQNKFGKYVPVCCSFKPKQSELVWQELEWEKRRLEIMMKKIKTLIAYDNEDVKNRIAAILGGIDDVEIVATSNTPEDTYNKIIQFKPEMVFAKYDFGTNMNGLDIIKQSKAALNDGVPAFNFIATDIPKEDFLEAKRIIGDKMNTIIREENPSRYTGIIKDYKDYMNYND